ncbi:MAG: SH3 domain-containing protein [Chloroflexi bacterium]|nr:SH3 domain-containing protein [Chloroflexota bacterium]
MPTPPRRCSTCRHFQPAPLWRKGWCRHPLLYAPHQNHLVDERELDCHRQFGDYWEAAEPGASEPAAVTTGAAEPSVRSASAPATDSPLLHAGASDHTSAAGQSIVAADGAATPAPASRVDRLRLLVPALIIGGLLVGYLLWTGLLMQAAGDVATPTAIVPTATVPVVATVAPTLAPTVASTVAPTAAPTARPTIAPTAPPTGTTAPAGTAAPVSVRPGAAAVVDTGSTDGLRLRREPGSAGVVLRSIRNGERVTVLDGPREVGGLTWWRVLYAGDEGWVAGQYLKPA